MEINYIGKLEKTRSLPMKMCRDCKIEKKAEDFKSNKRHLDGLDSYCKQCHNKRFIKYAQKIARQNR